MLGSSVRVCLNKTYWLLFEISWKSKTKSLLMSMMLLLKNYRYYKKCIFLNMTFIIIFLKVLYKKNNIFVFTTLNTMSSMYDFTVK